MFFFKIFIQLFFHQNLSFWVTELAPDWWWNFSWLLAPFSRGLFESFFLDRTWRAGDWQLCSRLWFLSVGSSEAGEHPALGRALVSSRQETLWGQCLWQWGHQPWFSLLALTLPLSSPSHWTQEGREFVGQLRSNASRGEGSSLLGSRPPRPPPRQTVRESQSLAHSLVTFTPVFDEVFLARRGNSFWSKQ